MKPTNALMAPSWIASIIVTVMQVLLLVSLVVSMDTVPRVRIAQLRTRIDVV